MSREPPAPLMSMMDLLFGLFGGIILVALLMMLFKGASRSPATPGDFLLVVAQSTLRCSTNAECPTSLAPLAAWWADTGRPGEIFGWEVNSDVRADVPCQSGASSEGSGCLIMGGSRSDPIGRGSSPVAVLAVQGFSRVGTLTIGLDLLDFATASTDLAVEGVQLVIDIRTERGGCSFSQSIHREELRRRDLRGLRLPIQLGLPGETTEQLGRRCLGDGHATRVTFAP